MTRTRIEIHSEQLLGALRHAWRTLEPLGFPMAVFGGISMSAWFRARGTQDVDILIGVDADARDAVLHHVIDAGFTFWSGKPMVEIDDVRFTQLRYRPEGTLVDYRIDLLYAENEFLRSVIERRVPAVLAGPSDEDEIAVVSPEDLILLKLHAGRIIDRVDAASVLRHNADVIDVAYVLKWVRARGLTDEFAVVWEEAFPGQSLPDNQAE